MRFPSAIREYAVNPAIHQTIPAISSYSPDGSKRTTDNIVSTAISGAATGGIRAKFYESSIRRNMLIFGGLFTAFQVIGNIVLQAKPEPASELQDSSASPPTTTAPPPAATAKPQQPVVSKTQENEEPRHTWWDMFKESLPIRRIPDEEYEASLAAREAALKEELKIILQTEKEWERRDQMQKSGSV